MSNTVRPGSITRVQPPEVPAEIWLAILRLAVDIPDQWEHPPGLQREEYTLSPIVKRYEESLVRSCSACLGVSSYSADIEAFQVNKKVLGVRLSPMEHLDHAFPVRAHQVSPVAWSSEAELVGGSRFSSSSHSKVTGQSPTWSLYQEVGLSHASDS
jgi:hypothetical protein